MRSLAILGGRVADGSGSEPVPANVLVEGERIAAVGPESFAADEVIDAANRIVAPGFIDIHTHSDLSLMVDRRGPSKLLQGVTCEVVGNCGMSPAPLRAGDALQRDSMSYMDQGIPWDWDSYADFLGRLEGCSVNVASLVGHIAVRSTVMGFEQRRPSPDELAQMRALLAECLEAGASGFSTGLIYPPSCYAETAEIAVLCEVVARRNRLYASHIRGEGRTLQESIAEAIEIGRRSGCRVQISHLKAAGKPHWGGVHRAMAQIEAARAEGIDVAFDVYPYVAGATQLTALLPPWVHAGGRAALLARLADPAVRERVRHDAENPPPDWPGYALRGRDEWDARRISGVALPDNEWMVGCSLWDIAQELGLDPSDAVCEVLLRDEARTSFVAFHISEDDMRAVLAHPLAAVASDGLAVSPSGVLGKGLPHPRFYGTFPRVLGRYVREEKVVTLSEAIRKMTAAPAERLGLADRGRVAAGYYADLVVFDPATVIDRATFEDPKQFPVGIDAVIVNGAIAARGQEITAARSGRVLRPPA